MKRELNTEFSRSLQLTVVVGFILLAFFFGVEGIAQDPIRRDESTTMGHIGAMNRDGSQYTLAQTWNSLITLSGEHPPLFYIAANAWGKLVSYDYRILRVLAVFVGVLALAVIYRLSVDFSSPRAGLWAIALLATFTFYHHYLHEIREYSTVFLCASLVWLVYYRTVTITKPTIWHYVGLGVASSLAMYAHPTAMFLFIAIGLYHLLFVPKDRRWWYVSLAVVIGGLTFVFWLPGLFSGVNTFNERLAEGEDKTLYNPLLIPQVMQFWGNGSEWMFVILMGVSLFATLRNVRGSRRILFFMMIVALGYLALNSYFPFIKRLRYVLVFVVPYIVFAGVGLAFLSRLIRWQVLPVAVLAGWIVFGSGFYKTPTFTDAVGTTAPLTFTEYHHLMPLLEAESARGMVMVNTIYNVSTMKDSKGGGMGIDEYYLSQFDIRNFNLRADVNRQRPIESIVEKVSEEPSFWLNYFRTDVIPQIDTFKQLVSDDFRVCREYEYGERSMLIHYVAVDQYDQLCPA